MGPSAVRRDCLAARASPTFAMVLAVLFLAQPRAGALALKTAEATKVTGLPTFPNIEYPTFGYDIVKGNPFATASDPGWQSPVIAMTYANGQTWDNKYAIPDWLQVRAAGSCSYSGSSHTMASASSYQAALNESVSVEASASFFGLLKASFSASSDYQNMFSGGRTGDTAYVGTSATCTSYTAAWDQFDFQPNFTSNFLSAVAQLGAGVTWLEFVEAFGTHYPASMMMGGTSFYYSMFNQSSLRAMEESDVDVTAAASLDFFVHAGASVTSDKHYSDWQTYSSNSLGSFAHGVPNPAPACGGLMCSDTSAWFDSIEALDGTGPGPSPLQMTLAPITSLLTPANFPGDPRITSKQEGLVAFLEDSYCGQVPGCAPPPPPPGPVAAWSQYLGNPQRTSLSPNIGPGGPGVYASWTFPTGGQVYTSPVIGADGTVFVGSCNANLYALEGKTGSVLWKFPTGGCIGSTPAIGADGTVYVASYDHFVYALAGATGAFVWKFETGSYVYSSPAISGDGKVYIGSGDSNVYALSAASGALVWKFAAGATVDASPALGVDGTVYVANTNGSVYSLDGSTGALKWKFTVQGNFGVVNPAIGADGTVFIGSTDFNLYALDGATGAVKWRYTTGNKVDLPAIGADGAVYFGSSDGSMYSVVGSTGALRWKFATTTGLLYYNGVAIGGDNTVYATAEDGNLYAWDGTSGTLKWKYTTPNSLSIGSSPAIGADGEVYFGGNDNNVYCIKGL